MKLGIPSHVFFAGFIRRSRHEVATRGPEIYFRRGLRSHLLSILAIAVLLAGMLFPGSPVQVAQAASFCVTSGPSSGAYTVTVCITAPVGGSSLNGVTTVTATAAVTVITPVVGTAPSVQRMIFSLNGIYLLTEYQAPYNFSLPTARWVDGAYTLSVQAMMRDSFTTNSASESVTFSNGVTRPPVNNNHFTPTSGTTPAPGAPFVVAAAGDGAGGEMNSTRVVNLAASQNPNLFLYLGDVYESGSPTEFYNWYGMGGSFFSQLRPITDPTIGNHEYSASSTAAGYFDYWDNIPNYYSFDAGGWHFVSLNSNYSRIGLSSGSAQYNWLKQDLSAHSTACTIVYYHHPLFNIGPEGPTTQLSDIWALMAQRHVTLVLNGHDHDYQRWVPLDGSGNPNPNGVTEIVAGGGGHGLQDVVNTDARVAYSNDTNPDAFGVLKLTLAPSKANFSYLSVTGTTLDSGSIPCTNYTGTVQPPAAPTGLTAQAVSPHQVNLAWQPVTDSIGLKNYAIFRDGALLATVSPSATSYQDTTVAAMTSYSYTVEATDSLGNHSAPSQASVISTPAITIFLPLIMNQ